MRGLETASDWCSPLRHSWTVQCWTRTEHFDWVTGTRALLGPGWQPPAVLHLTCDSKQRFLFYMLALLLILGWAPPPTEHNVFAFFLALKCNGRAFNARVDCQTLGLFWQRRWWHADVLKMSVWDLGEEIGMCPFLRTCSASRQNFLFYSSSFLTTQARFCTDVTHDPICEASENLILNNFFTRGSWTARRLMHGANWHMTAYILSHLRTNSWRHNIDHPLLVEKQQTPGAV